MFARECERVRAGRPPTTSIDMTRYDASAPSASRASDPAAWRAVMQSATSNLHHQDNR